MALFGRKDFQQFLVLSTMARELDFPVKVIGMQIVREEDGLAMSRYMPCICITVSCCQFSSNPDL